MMRVEIEEKATWPLTSPTTCYSGARSIVHHTDDKDKDKASRSFAIVATALHCIRISLLQDETKQHEGDSKSTFNRKASSVTWELVDDNSCTTNSNRICVGLAANAQYTVMALLANLETFVQASNETAAATLDEETTLQLRELLSTTNANTTAMETDTASVTTATGTGSVLTETSAAADRRHASTTDMDGFSTSGFSTSATAVGEGTESVTHFAASNVTPSSAAAPVLPLAPLQGWLVWKDSHDLTTIRGTLEIDFRPLALTLANVPVVVHNDPENNSQRNSSVRSVVWMGSADAARIIAYYWKEETSQLVPMATWDQEVFEVGSPVMAIDVQEIVEANGDDNDTATKTSRFLALACQDGTVRCIRINHYNANTQTWSATVVSQVIVDGPLVCLQFIPGTTLALVGSLCGYVMLQNNDSGSPMLVAAELQGNDGQGDVEEDPVLAVHGWDEWVAIGTQSGALLLYHKAATADNKENQPYVKIGAWRLPYSIHEICHHGQDLLVTTRKSLHLFTLHQQRPRFDANLVKERIQRLLGRASADNWNENPGVAEQARERTDSAIPEQMETVKQEEEKTERDVQH